MPISAVAYDSHVVLEIVPGDDFRDCLRLIRTIAAEDRKYDDLNQRYIIKHPEKYQYIKAIQRALASSKNQLRLF
jgi:hypothetical protein